MIPRLFQRLHTPTQVSGQLLTQRVDERGDQRLFVSEIAIEVALRCFRALDDVIDSDAFDPALQKQREPRGHQGLRSLFALLVALSPDWTWSFGGLHRALQEQI